MIELLVMAVAWFVIGYVALMVGGVRIAFRLVSIDKERWLELLDEAAHVASFGIIPKNASCDEIRSAVENATRKPWSVIFLKSLFCWPQTLAYSIPAMTKAIDQIDEDYKLGIRTRKEKEVS